MRARPTVCVLALLAALVPAVHAQDCNIGTGLASTLLVPYFEYDPNAGPAGVTTLFSVSNELSTPAVVRVVLWTDWGHPTLGFDTYLAPRSLQPYNVRDLFNGTIPSTGEGEDLASFNFCGSPNFRPFHANPALDGDEIAQLEAWHTGQNGPFDAMCAGEDHGDGVVRGYITVDVVDECSGIQLGETFSPAWASYFAEGGGGAGAIAIASNRLWGDFLVIDPSNDLAQGSEAVALWADPDRFIDDPTLTFYGRFDAYSGHDERVPLPSLWVSRFLNGGPFSGGTDLFVWRDTGSDDVSSVPCGGHPAWYPLPQSFATARDENGDGMESLGTGSELFPLATQKVPSSSFGLPYNFGRIQFGLADGPGLTNPRQAWVQTVLSAESRFSLGLNARSINELCDQAP